MTGLATLVATQRWVCRACERMLRHQTPEWATAAKSAQPTLTYCLNPGLVRWRGERQ
jgi:hypothetical protein